jgi:hypothetical protein
VVSIFFKRDIVTVEEFKNSHVPFTCNSSHEHLRAKGDVQKGALSKAAGPLARGAYSEYASTTKGGERR